MTFIRPEFLFGLLVLIIPVIIHLFNFRRHKKYYFSDISRLKNLTNKTKKKKKLKHLVILALRLLTIAAIVLALSGPVLNNSNKPDKGNSVTTIIIDNSNSMMAEGQSGRLFETARSNALSVVGSSADNTSFIILSGNPTPSELRIMDKEAAISSIEKLQISSGQDQLSNIFETRNRLLQRNDLKSKSTLVFSDFQIHSSDVNEISVDSTEKLIFVLSNHLNRKNLFIDSCAIETPAVMVQKTIDISVWIQNDSDIDYEKVPLRLTIDGQQKAVSAVDITKGSTKKITLNFNVSESGWHQGMVGIEDFPIIFDDKYYFVFNAVDNIRILIINHKSENQNLTNFYKSDDVFNVTNTNYRSVDLGILSKYDLIILNEIPEISNGVVSNLKKEVENGTNLLFIPSSEKSITSINNFLQTMDAGSVVSIDTNQTRVVGIKMTDELFSESIVNIPENADLPQVQKHYKYLFPTKSSVESLISLLSGGDFLSRKKIGSGNLYILSVGLDKSYSNFTSQVLFSPVMHGIAEKKGSSNINSSVLGQTGSIKIGTQMYMADEWPVELISLENKVKIIPGQRIINNDIILDLGNIEPAVGFHEVKHSDSLLAMVAFNYNRDESKLNFLSEREIESMCSESGISNFEILSEQQSEFSEVINALQKDSEFWKLFIIFALFTILAEVLVLRFWK